ncbi:receptor-like protein kinase [Tanacetum coccineum]
MHDRISCYVNVKRSSPKNLCIVSGVGYRSVKGIKSTFLTKVKLVVVALHLSNTQISEEIRPEISHLSQLKSLDLSFSHFSGPTPSQIGDCTRLQYLELSANSLSGNIPNTLDNLLTLKHLNLAMLQKLFIDNNQFKTGSLPFSINNLENLTYLDANSAGLKGQISLGYGGFVGSWLTGTIPSSFGQLTKMSLHYLPENFLSGSIPPEVRTLRLRLLDECTRDCSLDWHGKPALIEKPEDGINEGLATLAFTGVEVNMVLFSKSVLRRSKAESVNMISNWMGSVYL